MASSSRTRLLAAGLLGLAAAACSGKAAPAAPVVPPIEAMDTRGVVTWIRAQRGQPVLVNFWATWCGPCMEEMPDLLAGTRAFRARGGVVVGVAMEQLGDAASAEEALAKVRAKAPELGIDFPVLVCTDDDMNLVRRVLAVPLGGLPQTLVYDRAGKLVHQHEGTGTAAEFAGLALQAER